MISCGIDPGKKGALFLLTDTGHCYWDRSAMPVPLAKKKGEKDRPDYARMYHEWRVALQHADHIFIERVSAMPGQGVTGMFNFGYIAGFIYALALEAGKPITFVTPQKWKKAVGLIGADKSASRPRASKLLPECAKFWPLVKHEGIAEAAMIAYYGHSLLRNA